MDKINSWKSIVVLVLGLILPFAGSSQPLEVDQDWFVIDPPGLQGSDYEQLIGTNDMAPLGQYSETNFYRQLARPVGKLNLNLNNGSTAFCTGSLIAWDLVLTNAHCIADDEGNIRVSEGLFTTDYFEVGQRNLKAFLIDAANPVEIGASGGRGAPDYAIIRLIDVTEQDTAPWGTVSLGDTQQLEGQSLFIAHHPNGQPKTMSSGDECKTHFVSDANLHHLCDTLPGSSGAPVILMGANQVVALHFRAGNGGDNVAVLMSEIAKSSPTIRELLGTPQVSVDQATKDRCARAIRAGLSLPGCSVPPEPTSEDPQAVTEPQPLAAEFSNRADLALALAKTQKSDELRLVALQNVMQNFAGSNAANEALAEMQKLLEAIALSPSEPTHSTTDPTAGQGNWNASPSQPSVPLQPLPTPTPTPTPTPSCNGQIYRGSCVYAPGPGVDHTYWMHNGSIMILEYQGSGRTFKYVVPREGLSARTGDILFEGRRSGSRYWGRSKIFSRACGALTYEVEGRVVSETEVQMEGVRPVRNRSSCQTTGQKTDYLTFTYWRRSL